MTVTLAVTRRVAERSERKSEVRFPGERPRPQVTAPPPRADSVSRLARLTVFRCGEDGVYHASVRRILAAVATIVLAVASPQAQRPAPDVGRAGWDALNAGRLQDAAAAFAEALRHSPTPSVLVGAALVAHLQTRYEEARQHLVTALKMDPSLVPASVLLGEVLYRTGDIDGAILVYEQALARAPNHAQMLKKLEEWRKESTLHSRFGQRLSDHFTVLFEGPAESKLAERAAAILEAAYWRIGTALYTYPTDVITVVLYTREQFRDITQSPDWAGGAFDGRIRVPVQGALENTKELERVLAHEFTHALIRSIAPRGVPTWLNEGLAVQFEGADISRKRQQVREASEPLPLQRLEGPFGKLTPKEATLAYAQSAVAVHALIDLAGAPAVVNMLTDIGGGVPFAQAFERHILISYADFQNRLRVETP
jgi:tetratricopeptide (TPR) repeat protein